jgi:hypothetical protein
MSAPLLRSDSVSVIDYRCRAARGDKPFVERHEEFSVSYVRKGSFGYRRRGKGVRGDRRGPSGRPPW